MKDMRGFSRRRMAAFNINGASPPRRKRVSVAAVAQDRAGTVGRVCSEYDTKQRRKEGQ